jgi:hypothetical protein
VSKSAGKPRACRAQRGAECAGSIGSLRILRPRGRSGFSLLYSPTANLHQDAQPYQAAVNLAYTIINPTTEPINSFSNPFPGGVLQPVGRSSNYLSVINGQSVVSNIPKEPATCVEQWNLDIEKDLGHQTLFDIAYVGNHGVHQQLPAGLNDNGQGLDQIPDADLSLGSALLTPVPNPFYGLITSGSLAGPTIPAGQLLRPYPQYFNLWNAANTAAGSNYNALQTKIEKRFSEGGTEQINLQFRAEAFNLFNRVQFGQPNTVCCSSSNASFGVINSQLNLPRVVQFALRLSF